MRGAVGRRSSYTTGRVCITRVVTRWPGGVASVSADPQNPGMFDTACRPRGIRSAPIGGLALLAALGLLAAGCEDGSTMSADRGPPDARSDVGSTDPAEDAALDAGDMLSMDGAPDMAADGALVADAAPDPAAAACPVIPSPRAPDGLRVAGCRLVRDGEAAVWPRVVVVSGDSLLRAAATPWHEPAHWADLARAGVDVVWMPVLWSGIEPAPGTYNGAYTARLCQSARQAGEAGLGVVLALTQHRFGPALGGHGMPEWVTPPGLSPIAVDDPRGPAHPSLSAAWRAFWDGDAPAALTAAWGRLIDACALEEAPGIIGISALGAPHGSADDRARFAALADGIERDAEARLGPLLRFEHGLWVDGALRWTERDGPDRIRVVPGWGPARWPGAATAARGWRSTERDAARLAGRPLWLVEVGGQGPDAMNGALSDAEAAGLVPAVWQDGFGSPYGLRDEDGRPAATWAPALSRPRPALLAGRILAWRADDAGLTLRWFADGSDQGLSRLDLAGRLPGEARLDGGPAVDWFTDYDPASGLLAVFVEGAVGVVELTVPFVEPMQSP